MADSRRLLASLLAVAAVTCALLPGPVFADSKPNVPVPSALLMTMDGHVLWSRHPDTQRRVASTIKMLNVLVVREHTGLNDTVTVSAKAARTPDGVGLWKGERLTVRQLLLMTLVASANDAAEALAIHIGGTEANYVELMNAKAKALGLKHTLAYDPHGLGKKEHSSARDLAVLARTVMADPVLRGIVAMRTVSVPRRHGKASKKVTTDRLLGHYAGIEGVKTGFTNPAGYCFVGAAKRNGVELVSVILGARSISERFSESRKLLDWGFAGFKIKRVVSTSMTRVVAVKNGVVPTDSVHPSRDVSCAVWTRGAAVVASITLPAEVLAPIHHGDQLGVVRAMQGTWRLASVSLVADSDVASTAPAPVPAPAPSAAAQSAAPRRSLWQRLLLAVSVGLLWGRTGGSS